MSFLELLLGLGIVTMLGIGSIVAAEPFWGPRRGDRSSPTRAARADRRETARKN